ncbi:MAG: hypothetical protein ACQESE_02910 [Nanobdellota archaeon]
MAHKEHHRYYKVVLAISFLGLLGLFFLGSGITGMVTSQTCCNGPDCDPEYRCDYAKQPDTETPSTTGSLAALGLLMIIIASMFYHHHKKKHDHIPPVKHRPF